jgi:Zn-dependent peptidase ImmA (M78 family)/transcriptional regulator with XRE-family HTH domain
LRFSQALGYGTTVTLDVDTLAERVLTAIESSGQTRRAVAEAIGMDVTAMSKALSGQRHFKALEIALIAEHLGVPVQEFYSDEDDEAQPASIAARAQPNSNPAVDQALARAQQMLDLDALLRDQGFPAAPAHRSWRYPELRAYEQGEWIAKRLRSALSLRAADLPAEVEPLATYIEEKLNIDVAIEPLPGGLDGLAVTHRPFALIMVSSSIPATRQRHIIAHELGHLLAGDGSSIIDENINFDKTPAEARANAFAAAFLMPKEALRAAFAGYSDISEQLVADLLGRYRVSLDALAFRLYNADLIDAADRDLVRRMSSARISLRQGRAKDLQARGDRRWPGGLLDRAVQAYVGGRISIRPIGELVGVAPDTLLEELAPPHLGPVDAASAQASEDDLVPML